MINLFHLLCKQFYIAVYLSVICMNLISFHFKVYLFFCLSMSNQISLGLYSTISDVVLVIIKVGICGN